MVAAFPVAKLAAIFIKQVSKPLANAVKTRAKTSPFFRNYVCMPPAQFYHWAEIRVKMWSMNLGKPVNIPKLNEAMAIELGAELVGESVIFVIAAAILSAEYVRSSRKEAAREEEKRQELVQIQNDLRELYFTKARLETQVKELVRILHVQLPTSSYNPDDPNWNDVPEHHRDEKSGEEEGGGIISGLASGLSSLVWNAIELVLPTVDDGTPPNKTPESKAPSTPPASTETTTTLKSTTNSESSSVTNITNVKSEPGCSNPANNNNNNTNTPKR